MGRQVKLFGHRIYDNDESHMSDLLFERNQIFFDLRDSINGVIAFERGSNKCRNVVIRCNEIASIKNSQNAKRKVCQGFQFEQTLARDPGFRAHQNTNSLPSRSTN